MKTTPVQLPCKGLSPKSEKPQSTEPQRRKDYTRRISSKFKEITWPVRLRRGSKKHEINPLKLSPSTLMA